MGAIIHHYEHGRGEVIGFQHIKKELLAQVQFDSGQVDLVDVCGPRVAVESFHVLKKQLLDWQDERWKELKELLDE